jgi:16S rRNA C967 or C1407 C5-methylase (RsmB/RsmF family)
VISDFLAAHADAALEVIDLGLSGESWWKSGLTHFGDIQYGDELVDTVRILPSAVTEGFYMAKIRKI